MTNRNASHDIIIHRLGRYQTRSTDFRGLERRRIVSTTFQTRLCVPSVNTTKTAQSRRMRFSITSTACCMLQAIESSSQTICRKELPRIPFAPDFHAFAEVGGALAVLHLGYETCEQYPLSLVSAHNGEPQPHHFRLTEKAMRFATPAKTTLIINEHVRLTGIPEMAHRYVVNGRTPLEWFIDRYKIKRDKESGILNDPNGWFENPHGSGHGNQAHRSCERGIDSDY